MNTTTHTNRPVRRWAMLVSAAVAAAVAIAPLPAAAHNGAKPPDASRDPAVIGQWNAFAMEVLTPSGRPLITQPFVVAAMHVAIYDAVVAVEGGAKPFGTRLTAPPGTSSQAAAAAAAHGVLVGFLPTNTDAFDTALANSLAAIPDGTAETNGVAVGRAAAAATLAYRLVDGSQSGPLPPVPAPAPGVWAPTPPATSGLNPWVTHAIPFALHSPDQFRPGPPPRLDSRRFLRDLDEVRRLGGSASTERTEEQTAVARFWADQPVAQSQRALRNHAAKLGWDILETSRLFAALLTSQVDALTACWDAKYHYEFWRPWQSVPTIEPGWTPLLPTPNHPEYPSSHACLTGATAFALARIMQTEAIDFEVDAANIGITRHYPTRDDLTEEIREARIWGGVHYRFSIEAGLRLAEKVVKFNLNRNFRLTSR